MTAGKLPTASRERAVALRQRADLVVAELQFAGLCYWAVKDPIALRYFQLRDEEYFILQQLDGHVSMEELIERFEEHFAPRRLNIQQLQNYLGMLHRNSLVYADQPMQAEPLLERKNKHQRKEWVQAFSNLLAIRLRGVDPQRFLNWLYPKCRWMFSRWTMAAGLVLVLAALALVLVQWESLQERLPAFQAFFSVTNLLWIALSMAVIKVLHELGHALSCKHFGGTCHELGIMFLVFTPCLYCNVTDSWMMPNKWHRIAIGAAGIYVELVLAAVATFLWWYSEPGLLNTLALNTMFICSVSTILFNGNPLLRYDGYYVLSDLAEVPNLAQQSDSLVRNSLAKWFLGMELANDRMMPDRRKEFIAIYGVTSKIYRVFVVFAILWFVYQFLKPYDLQVLAQLLATMTIVSMFIIPAGKAVKFLFNPAHSHQVKRGRLWFTGGALALLIALVTLVPLPYRVAAPLVVQPKGAMQVYVSVPGRLIEAVKPGDMVQKGALLAKLENQQLAQEVVQLSAKRNEQALHVENLNKLRNNDPTASGQIPAAMKMLADLNNRLKKRLSDQEQLMIKSPLAGVVMPVRKRPKEQATDALDYWTGTPLDKENRGSHLETGTLLCRIGDPDKQEALLIVDQSDIEMISRNQPVHLRFNSLPGEVFFGKIEEIAEIDLEIAPPELVASGQLPIVQQSRGNNQLAVTTYQVRVSFDLRNRPLLLSATGEAKVHTAPRSIGWRLLQYVRKTFRFEL